MHSIVKGVAIAMALGAAAPAAAQENIVVTGSRIVQRLGANYVIPQVGLERRADFLLRTVYVSCDTREEEPRAQELRTTLRGMIAAADRSDDIELSQLVQINPPDPDDYYASDNTDEDALVVPFTEADVDSPLLASFGGRVDTSYVQLLVKTPIREDDTLASAVKRIEDFVDGVDTVGRSALDLDEADALSVVDPAQYRDAIFTAMSEDAQARIASLGDGYAASFTGLENKVTWYRSDVLDLTLFIPHTLAIGPAS
jgi:hypothetical protein